MPRNPRQERIRTRKGVAPDVGEVSDEESYAAVELPESVFDEKQRQMGQYRKPSGPPLDDDEDESFGAEAPGEDVPPTEPADADQEVP